MITAKQAAEQALKTRNAYNGTVEDVWNNTKHITMARAEMDIITASSVYGKSGMYFYLQDEFVPYFKTEMEKSGYKIENTPGSSQGNIFIKFE